MNFDVINIGVAIHQKLCFIFIKLKLNNKCVSHFNIKCIYYFMSDSLNFTKYYFITDSSNNSA